MPPETCTYSYLIEITKLGGAAVAFGFAYFQFVQTQKWKRREYISAQMEKFSKNPDVIVSMQMLDWMERPLTLKNGKVFEYDRRALKRILCSSSNANVQSFSIEEAELRDSFSGFLDQLQQIDGDIESGLINKEEIEVYLRYWLQKLALASSREEKQVVKLVDSFIDDYGYNGVKRLVSRYLDTKSDSLTVVS